MVVREHDPEARYGRGGNAKSQLGNVTLDESADELSAPRKAVLFACGKESPWKAAAQPKRLTVRGGRLRKVKSGHFNYFHPTSQRFGGLS